MCVDGQDAVNTVTNGDHPLQYYDIIFMDFTMPILVSYACNALDIYDVD